MNCPLYDSLFAELTAAQERERLATKSSGEALIDSEINLEHLTGKLAKHVSECLVCANKRHLKALAN